MINEEGDLSRFEVTVQYGATFQVDAVNQADAEELVEMIAYRSGSGGFYIDPLGAEELDEWEETEVREIT